MCWVCSRYNERLTVVNPLGANKFTGNWTPPIDQKHIITAVSRNQGSAIAAAFAEDVSLNFTPLVFTSNVAANTFGPVVKITDPNFTSGSNPAMAYDSGANQIILEHSTLGNPFVPPVIGIVDMNQGGAFTSFRVPRMCDSIRFTNCSWWRSRFRVQRSAEAAFWSLTNWGTLRSRLTGLTSPTPLM